MWALAVVMVATTTIRPIPNGDDDDTSDDDDSAQPETCEVTVSSIDLDDPNAARHEWAFDFYGNILNWPGGGMTFTMATNSQVGVVLTGAQSGGISRLRVETSGDCDPDDIAVSGEWLGDQANPIHYPLIAEVRDAWEADDGTFTTLAYDPKTGIVTATAPHDEHAEVWVLTR